MEYMELRQSVDQPEAGQGAFAKVHIEKGTIFSLYSGMILNYDDVNRSDQELYKLESKNKWTRNHPKAGSSWKYR
jgi:hypothetical protein